MRKTYHRYQKKPKYFYRINQYIRLPKIFLIDENNEKIGEIETFKALQMAQERELDLVEINPKVQPPIVKIMDFGKFKYQKEKEIQKQKARQRKGEVKGIRLSLRINPHDLEIRLKQAAKFLEENNKLKIEMVLKGREKQHLDLANQIINDFINKINSAVEIKQEQPLSRQGGRLAVVLAKKNISELQNSPN